MSASPGVIMKPTQMCPYITLYNKVTSPHVYDIYYKASDKIGSFKMQIRPLS